VAVARVDEELGARGLHELPGRRQVLLGPFVPLVHVDLERNTVRPGAVELGRREGCAEEQRALCARACLRERLRRHDAEREPGVDDPSRQAFGGGLAPLEDRAEAGLSRVTDAVFEVVEGVALVEVRRVHDMPAGAELISEGEHAGCEALRVMKEHDLGHGGSLKVAEQQV
jgi:hypothetical protein